MGITFGIHIDLYSIIARGKLSPHFDFELLVILSISLDIYYKVLNRYIAKNSAIIKLSRQWKKNCNCIMIIPMYYIYYF